MQVAISSPIDVVVRDDISALYRKIALRLLPFLCVCLALSSVDRINVSFAKLQMLSGLRFNDAIYGFGAGIFFVGYILFEVPSNAVLQRVGAHLWIGRIMIGWGIVSTLMMFVKSPGEFYTLRFLLGVCEAGGLPGILFYLTSWFPSHRRGQVTAMLMLGGPLASVMGGPLSGWIMRQFNQNLGLGGWQWLFLLEGLPSVLLGVAALFVLPRSPAVARFLSDRQKSLLASELAADSAHHETAPHRFLDGLFNLKVWILGGIDFSILLTSYVVAFWMPSFLRSAGVLDLVTIGMLTAIPSIAGVGGMLFLGSSSDRHRERRWHIIIPFLITAASLALSGFFMHSVVMIVLLFTIAVCMVSGAMPVFFTLPPTFLKGPAMAAGFALAVSLASIAGLISNALTGFLVNLTGSGQTALWFFAASLLVSCCLVLCLPAKLVNR